MIFQGGGGVRTPVLRSGSAHAETVVCLLDLLHIYSNTLQTNLIMDLDRAAQVSLFGINCVCLIAYQTREAELTTKVENFLKQYTLDFVRVHKNICAHLSVSYPMVT